MTVSNLLGLTGRPKLVERWTLLELRWYLGMRFRFALAYSARLRSLRFSLRFLSFLCLAPVPIAYVPDPPIFSLRTVFRANHFFVFLERCDLRVVFCRYPYTCDISCTLHRRGPDPFRLSSLRTLGPRMQLPSRPIFLNRPRKSTVQTIIRI